MHRGPRSNDAWNFGYRRTELRRKLVEAVLRSDKTRQRVCAIKSRPIAHWISLAVVIQYFVDLGAGDRSRISHLPGELTRAVWCRRNLTSRTVQGPGDRPARPTYRL